MIYSIGYTKNFYKIVNKFGSNYLIQRIDSNSKPLLITIKQFNKITIAH